MKSSRPAPFGIVIRASVVLVSLALLSLVVLMPSFVLAQSKAPTLKYHLPEDPHDQPLLRRSIVIEDAELRSIELKVDDYEQQKARKKRRQRIFFEDIESLDESPFVK
ncbi:MAG: hypothetical protein OXF05_05290 [Hyphomicrobiales bacterium]|nr:hypothetical protein [Hyphomicrobiales bacterium]MCY4032809.1 hypothetical protein [Hyphomicrobiales bacterium]MCY4039106.1 hypothetical protein [Hyphomicrobiales bacterium]